MHRFSENVKYDAGLYLVKGSATATVYTGSSVNMAKYNNYCAIFGGVAVVTNSGTNNIGDLTAVIAQSTNGTVWAANYLATAVAASATGGLPFGSSVECRAEQMADGYRYLRVEVTPAAGTENSIAAANLRFNSRFLQVTLPA